MCVTRWTTSLSRPAVGATVTRDQEGDLVNGLNKGIGKVEVAVKWDPSPAGEPPTDLDLVAATYLATNTYENPDYVVHFDSRSPDGTITLNRDSKDGKGF